MSLVKKIKPPPGATKLHEVGITVSIIKNLGSIVEALRNEIDTWHGTDNSRTVDNIAEMTTEINMLLMGLRTPDSRSDFTTYWFMLSRSKCNLKSLYSCFRPSRKGSERASISHTNKFETVKKRNHTLKLFSEVVKLSLERYEIMHKPRTMTTE